MLENGRIKERNPNIAANYKQKGGRQFKAICLSLFLLTANAPIRVHIPIIAPAWES